MNPKARSDHMRHGLLAAAFLMCTCTIPIACGAPTQEPAAVQSHRTGETWIPQNLDSAWQSSAIVAYDFGASWVPGQTESIQWPPIEAAARREANKLSVVIFFAAWVRNDRIELSEEGVRRLKTVVALKKINPKLRVELGVGGFPAAGFSEAAASTGSRELFAQSAVDFVTRYDLDGIDIDWEFPGSSAAGITSSPRDRRDFTLLLKALHSALDSAASKNGRAYTVSVALGSGHGLEHVDIPAINQFVSWFNVMTYAMCGDVTCFHTGLYSTPDTPVRVTTTDRAVWNLLEQGVEAHKIFVGSSFQAREYSGVNPTSNGLFQPYEFQLTEKTGNIPWKTLKAEYIGKKGFVRYWDPVAHAPWLWNASTHQFITYEDPESAAAKATFARENHLGGVMFYSLGMDPSGDLVQAIWRGLHPKAVTDASRAGE